MAKAQQIIGIDCEGSAAEAIRLVLISRFDEMCALRDNALNWDDPEGVHDMRVSSRRLRGALRDFAPYLHKRRLSTTLKQIKGIASALGAVRDQDVAIIGLQKLASGAPTETVAMLNQLIQVREAIRKEARRELQRSLRKVQLSQLQKDFVGSMESAVESSKPPKVRSKGAKAAMPSYRDVARSTILERLKEMEKLSDALYQPLKIKPLHRLRIGAKHLRYALELFEPCWGPDVSTVAKKIAALQSSLGELHDSDTWIDTLGDHLKGFDQQSEEKGSAALWLLSHFVRLHAKHLRDSLGKWRDWEGNGFARRLRDCLQENPPEAAAIVESPPSIATQEP